MPTHDEVTAALYEAILVGAKYQASQKYPNAQEIAALAEAFAWVTSPGQPHGGRSKVEVKSS